MAIAEISVVPLGTGETSLSAYVAACAQILKNQDLVAWELTAMGTVLEGELQDILELTRTLHESPFTRGAVRVSTTLRIDDRRDQKSSMISKVQSVVNRLGNNGPSI